MGLTEKRFRARLKQLKANLEAAKNMPLEVLIAKIAARIRGKSITGIIGATWNVGQGLMDYYLNPSAKRQSKLPKQNYEQIRADMESAGLRVVPYRINVADFYKWLDKAAFPKKYADSYGPKFVEMHNFYFADSSPWADRRGLDYQGAVRVWRDDGSTLMFSRKYSVDTFIERVVKPLGSLSLTIYFIENEKEVDPICYCKFAAVFQK